jgi:hypothetical protein
MILFLRNRNNNTIVDLECYVKRGEVDNDYRFVELSVSVDILYYSAFLLENLDRKEEVIVTFSHIQELRGWLWETYFNGQKSDPSKYDDVIAVLRVMLKDVAQKYDLIYVED